MSHLSKAAFYWQTWKWSYPPYWCGFDWWAACPSNRCWTWSAKQFRTYPTYWSIPQSDTEPYRRWSLEVCFLTLRHCSFSCLPWNKNLATSNWKSIQIGFGVHLDYGNLVLFCFVSSAAFFKQYIWIIVGAVN